VVWTSACPIHSCTPDVGFADHARAERVSEIVEAQRSQAGCAQRSAVAAQQRRRVEVTAEVSDEDEIVRSNEALPLPESR
jgi:hypothetical protein